MSIETILNDIDQIIEEAKSVPFSSKRMVDAEEISQMIEEIRLNMPVEITQAKKIAQERRDILNEAEANAEEIIAKARERANLMIEEHQITKEARENAMNIMQQANNEASATLNKAKAEAREVTEKAETWSNDIRANASNYVENIIRDTDETLTNSVNDIRRLRQSVRDALHANMPTKPNFD
ncbi:MAG: hypothetical protein II738_05395 [Clostridia bacterium]|nr:hypothetical protein [Clostridia bacterium]